MSRFSEVARIEAAIKNKNSKELEWSIWYCQMRQRLPSALKAHVKYWSEMEDKVRQVTEPPVAEVKYPAKKKRAGRGLGMGPME
ncbi:MAG TPA: hypothetical protein VIX42_11980 [Edaphobacter sp.]